MPVFNKGQARLQRAATLRETHAEAEDGAQRMRDAIIHSMYTISIHA